MFSLTRDRESVIKYHVHSCICSLLPNFPLSFLSSVPQSTFAPPPMYTLFSFLFRNVSLFYILHNVSTVRLQFSFCFGWCAMFWMPRGFCFIIKIFCASAAYLSSQWGFFFSPWSSSLSFFVSLFPDVAPVSGYASCVRLKYIRRYQLVVNIVKIPFSKVPYPGHILLLISWGAYQVIYSLGFWVSGTAKWFSPSEQYLEATDFRAKQRLRFAVWGHLGCHLSSYPPPFVLLNTVGPFVVPYFCLWVVLQTPPIPHLFSGGRRIPQLSIPYSLYILFRTTLGFRK